MAPEVTEETGALRGWPKGVRPIGYDGAERLGVDDGGGLYWDGKPVEVRRRLDLTFRQRLGALIVGTAIVIGAFGAVVQGLDAGFDLGCKLHWRWLSCSPHAGDEVPASQFTPPETSPQSEPQKLLPGTKFQQR